MKLNITDDDGFIAIVNGARYQSFLEENWQLDKLMSHFVDQMNIGNIIIWQTSNDGGGNWCVKFQEEQSTTPAFRQFTQSINVTSGELFLTNYSDLTMAAQYSDVPIPSVHNTDLKIELENGFYEVTIKQLFDPSNCWEYFDDQNEDIIAFEVIISPSLKDIQQMVNNVYWIA